MAISVPEGTSDGVKLVYLYLKAATNATINELRDALGLTLLRLHVILRQMNEDGLITFINPNRVRLESAD